MPLPGGPIHRVPALQWKTLVRLAFVEAVSDWRSLTKLAAEGGNLRDYLIMSNVHSGMLGVNAWQALGVRSWDKPTGTIAGQQSPGHGAYAVADPRHSGPAKHSNEFRIVNWAGPAQAVTSAHGTGQAVADPCQSGEGFGKYGVTAFDAPAGTVISSTGQLHLKKVPGRKTSM